MCGITGFISKKNYSEKIIQNMVSVIEHRGPDSEGYFTEVVDSNYTISLGHSRLAIIDLTAEGHQPMHFLHYSIVFNGEIYNYLEIKNELLQLGHQFKSNSDTEVILHAFNHWGIKSVEKFIGMYAFVIYDKIENKLFCCTDRAGVKPFYYFTNGISFAFASELKSIYEFPEFEKNIDPRGVNLYFKYGYVPAPNSIFKNTFKLDGGNWLIYDIVSGNYEIKNYWDVNDVFSKPIIDISYSEAKTELKNLFKSAFEYRMVSDVPVGVFLSGGYDSTLVTSILQQNTKEKLKTFTIGFKHGNNEAPFAKQIASYLGTDHFEMYCTEKEALDIVKDLPNYYDEPFADSSAIPTILVSRMAKKEVTVALSADAGDEIFVGYNRYRSLYRYLNYIQKLPKSSRKIFSESVEILNKLVPKDKYFVNHQLSSLSNVLKLNYKYDASLLLDSIESAPENFTKQLLINYNNEVALNFHETSLINCDFNRAMVYDFKMYLQNDILTKVDRASMSVSLESREPLLDHRIVEFAATLPFEYKYDGITTKKILKDIVHDYIPKELMERPKTGFSVPMSQWLKHDIKEIVDVTFDWSEMQKQGVFNISFLKKIYTEFHKNQFHKSELIWRVFQFQLWYNKWVK